MAKKKLLEVVEDLTTFGIENNIFKGRPVLNKLLFELDKHLEQELIPPSPEKLDSWRKLGDCAILHCSGSGIVPKLIKGATGSKYSHTAIFKLIQGIPMIIDSQIDGTKIRSFAKWIEKYNYNFTATDGNGIIDMKEVNEHIGSKYDFRSLLIRQPYNLITKKWLKDVKSEERLYCSEFVATCMHLPNAKELSPKELRKLCSTHKVLLELWEN
jgi:hypothetical protein